MRVRNSTRRDLLKSAAGGTALGMLGVGALSRPAWAARRAPPGERIGVGLIGTGDLGRNHHLRILLGRPEVDVVALCDVDQDHLDEARKMTEGKAAAYHDFRALLDSSDVDAVLIATPDHWHALAAIAACESGKDVYCEKPLSLTIAEGRRMVEAARRTGRVFQTGSQQRSDARFHWACELVRNGRLGELRHIQAVLGSGPVVKWERASAPPATLDWDFWLGPAPRADFAPGRCHYQFRWFYDYSGGKLTDWGAHHIDIAQWALGQDAGGPVEVEGVAQFPSEGLSDTPVEFDVNYRYANGVTLHCTSKGENGVTFFGREGTLFVSRSEIRADPPEILATPAGAGPVLLQRTLDHHTDWLECIASRARPICDVEVGHRSASACHLGNIAIRLGRKLTWDPATERFLADEEADRMISKPMRSPWSV
jgi:predicted dehydrogenase